MEFPKNYVASEEGTVAYDNLTDRLPVILTRVIDLLVRTKDEISVQYGEEAREETKSVVGMLSKLRNEMQTNKPLIPLDQNSNFPDIVFWSNFLEKYPGANYFDHASIHIECYVYRRMFEAFERSVHLKNFDYFGHQKREAFTGSWAAVKILGEHLFNQINQFPNGKIDTEKRKELRVPFFEFLKMAVWGNRCDLSLSSGMEVSQHLDPVAQMQEIDHLILANHSARVWEYIYHLQSMNITKRLDIIMDNAGYELFTDLCLAEFLVATKLFDKVHFHPKAMPWFVSDVNEGDFMWVLETLKDDKDPVLSALGRKWLGYVDDGTWIMERNSRIIFWTLPYEFFEMKEIDRPLYNHLSDSHLIVIKGDLNHRKLIGDLVWDRTTPFDVALREFTPAPLCTLRTIKFESAVGLPQETLKELDEKNRGWGWMTTGEYAVIQFYNNSNL